MLEKTQKIKNRYDELTKLVSDPDVIADINGWKKLIKERNEIEDIALNHEALEKVENEMESVKKELSSPLDSEMKELFEAEYYGLKDKREELIEKMKVLLLPKDENDDKNVIIEIRAGAGGEEAALFAGVLFTMYARYAEREGWSVQVLDTNPTDIGGYKEVDMRIEGKNAYSRLKFESGVHRVQRVPETESQGRVHTSTATVAVLPELEEVDFEINEKDIRVDTYRSSGAGGQHINKTDSAIRITHFPTGIVVSCQDERSQTKNKERAFSVLRSKLHDYYQSQADKEHADLKRSQVGTGDRSERIRTYNYPQGRITDHRIGYSVFNMESFLDGEIDEMLDELFREDQKRKLENASNG